MGDREAGGAASNGGGGEADANGAAAARVDAGAGARVAGLGEVTRVSASDADAADSQGRSAAVGNRYRPRQAAGPHPLTCEGQAGVTQAENGAAWGWRFDSDEEDLAVSRAEGQPVRTPSNEAAGRTGGAGDVQRPY